MEPHAHAAPVQHESALIAGTKCNGCPALEIIVTVTRRKTTERYWCDRKRRSVRPHDEPCDFDGPKIGKARGFNDERII